MQAWFYGLELNCFKSRINSKFHFSGIAMSVEPVQLKMEDFTNIVMNVNVVSNNLGVIVKSVTDVLYQIMTSVQVIQLRK